MRFLVYRQSRRLLARLNAHDWTSPDEREQLFSELFECQRLPVDELVSVIAHEAPDAVDVARRVILARQLSGTAAALIKLGLSLERDGDDVVRERIVGLLPLLGETRGLEQLTGMLQSTKVAEADFAFQAIVAFPAVRMGKALSILATSSRPAWRAVARARAPEAAQQGQVTLPAELLWKLVLETDGAEREPLLEQFLSTADSEQLLAVAMTTQGSDAATADLIRRVDAVVIAHQEELVTRMDALLEDPNPVVRCAALRISVRAGSGERIFHGLTADSQQLGRWLEAGVAATLEQLDDVLVEALTPFVRDDSSQTRAIALAWLAQAGPPKGMISVLVEALADPDWWVRVQAVDALRRSPRGATMAAMVSLFDDDERRWGAAEVLAGPGHERALRLIVNAYTHAEFGLQLSVVRAIEEAGDHRLLPFLNAVIRADAHPELTTRANVAFQRVADDSSGQRDPRKRGRERNTWDWVDGAVSIVANTVSQSGRSSVDAVRRLEEARYRLIWLLLRLVERDGQKLVLELGRPPLIVSRDQYHCVSMRAVEEVDLRRWLKELGPEIWPPERRYPSGSELFFQALNQRWVMCLQGGAESSPVRLEMSRA